MCDRGRVGLMYARRLGTVASYRTRGLLWAGLGVRRCQLNIRLVGIPSDCQGGRLLRRYIEYRIAT